MDDTHDSGEDDSDAVGRTEATVSSGGSLTLSILEELDTSVLMVERPADRPVRERLFGRR